MAVSTPAGFTTIVTLLLFIRDNFCTLTNSCRHASSCANRNRIWLALQFLHESFCSLYRAKMIHTYLSQIVHIFHLKESVLEMDRSTRCFQKRKKKSRIMLNIMRHYSMQYTSIIIHLDCRNGCRCNERSKTLTVVE